MKAQTAGARTSTGQGPRGRIRWATGAIAACAVAAVVTAGAVMGRAQQSGNAETAVATSGQEIQTIRTEAVDALGGVAERVQYHRVIETQAQLAAHLAQMESADWAAPYPLSSSVTMPAGVMGGVAERITLQAQAVAGQTGHAHACGTTATQLAC